MAPTTGHHLGYGLGKEQSGLREAKSKIIEDCVFSRYSPYNEKRHYLIPQKTPILAR
jgi:hypothetical protein